MRALGRALALAFLALAACDELGNPSGAMHTTQSATWTDGANVLVTRTYSVAPERSNELVRWIAPDRMHYVDDVAPTGGVVTLVVVEPELRLLPPLRALPLVTELRLRDGSVVRRNWLAPVTATRFYAGFGLPAQPREAVTALALPGARIP